MAKQKTTAEVRILDEGYGPGAWHGADMKAAVADVPEADAFWRPGKGRHNIAEIVLHHAFYVHSVQGRITGKDAEPFALAGEDWFAAADGRKLSWAKIQELLASEQKKLRALTEAIAAGTTRTKLDDADRFGLILGITCHAVYHAGQVQLIKAMRAVHAA